MEIATKVKHYDVVWFVNSVPMETPLKNKSFPLCKWFLKNNLSKYEGGKLTIVETDNNRYK